MIWPRLMADHFVMNEQANNLPVETTTDPALVMIGWAMLGALISLGATIAGLFVAGMTADPCTGMLCGLDEAFQGLGFGYITGALGASCLGFSASEKAEDGIRRGLSAFGGAVVLLLSLFALLVF